MTEFKSDLRLFPKANKFGREQLQHILLPYINIIMIIILLTGTPVQAGVSEKQSATMIKLPPYTLEATKAEWLKLTVGDVDFSLADKVVLSGDNGYCRLAFPNGDKVHQGPETRAAYSYSKDQLVIKLWKGNIVLYGSSSLTGKKLQQKLILPMV
jgi:hypothetical protein